MSEQVLKVLLDSGIPEHIAKAMLKGLTPKATSAKAKTKKVHYGGFTTRTKVNAPIVVNKTCSTCKTVTSFKRVAKVYSDETHIEQDCTTSLCENCLKMFENMSKDDLITLLVLKNHPDVEIRLMTTSSHIRMAKQKSALEWLTTILTHCIPWEDREKEEKEAV